MGKQTKPRKPESFGKGKVTPIQIAFIVDRYLCDNNFSETRSTFRTEASSLIASSPINEVPKSLLSLGEMLNEYICLKEQKVMLDQERIVLEQEKNRVQMLLQGMQNVMNTYNASRTLPAPNVVAMNAKSAVVPQPRLYNRTPSGFPSTTTTTTAKTTTTMQNTPHEQSLPKSINADAETRNFSTPAITASDRKRKATQTVDAPSVAKKSLIRSSSRKIPVQGQNTLPQSSNAVNNQVVSRLSSATQSSAGNYVPTASEVQGSSVAKCLFRQPSLSIPANSPVPKTPTRANSSHSDTYISPREIFSVATCNDESTPTCYTVISTKRVMVSPAKQMAYIENSRCISPVKTDSDRVNKRDHVRSRLDFDASGMPESLDKSLPNEISASQSDEDVDLFDIYFPNLDALGMDFSFTEILGDLEFPCEGIDFLNHPAPSHSKYNASGSSNECKADQVTSELPSTVSEALSEKDMNIQGSDCLTATKSVTRCIKILSPVKTRQRCFHQENC